MPSGSKPGERRGGRKKGTKNRPIEERLEAKSREHLRRARMTAAEVFAEDGFNPIAAMKACYQKLEADEETAKAARVAADLAKYHSPALANINVVHEGDVGVQLSINTKAAEDPKTDG